MAIPFLSPTSASLRLSKSKRQPLNLLLTQLGQLIADMCRQWWGDGNCRNSKHSTLSLQSLRLSFYFTRPSKVLSEEFCGRIELTTGASRLHKIIAKDRAISSACLKNEDGTFTKNRKDRIHLFLKTHYPGFYPTAKFNCLTRQQRTEGKKGQKRYARKLKKDM